MSSNSLYAKPVLPRIVVRPALASLLLHGLMIYLLTVNLDFGERDEVRIKPPPVAADSCNRRANSPP